MADAYPDVVIGCAGGGTNFAGLSFPFIREKLGRQGDVRIVAVEPAACPTLTRGVYAYDFGDTGKMTPLVKMHTLGHTFVPAGIHAGGLRYHGMAPLVSPLYEQGLIEARAVHADTTSSRPPSSSPAPRASCRRRSRPTPSAPPSTRRCAARRPARRKTILFNLCGHGHFDLSAYEQLPRRPARGLRVSGRARPGRPGGSTEGRRVTRGEGQGVRGEG